MTFDADIFREILLRIDYGRSRAEGINVQIDGCDAHTISEHVRLLRDSGYLEAQAVTNGNQEVFKPVCLTRLGRNFLDAAIYDMVWETAKDLLREKGTAFTLDALSSALRIVAPPVLDSP
jgi:hypothetical protein